MADKTTPGGVLHDPVNGKRLDEPSAVNLEARLREVSAEAGDEADRAEAAAKDAAASAARAEAIVPGIEAEVRAVVLASPELKGEPGAPGPAPSIKIGTVTSGATPSATIKGTSPDLTLDLVLPQPAPGAVVDPYSIRGPGRPDVPSTTGGVITGSEPVGAEYRSTDGANVGAWTWRKRPGNVWAVTDGDTGWRALTLGAPYTTSPTIRVRRIGATSYLTFGTPQQWGGWNPGAAKTSSVAVEKWVPADPAGFRPTQRTIAQIYQMDTGAVVGSVGWSTEGFIGGTHTASSGMTFLLASPTAEAWPASLPGTPA